jgi:type II secretory pathway predicted ATPase ExeA/septal ring-binding cell division protein DamX
MYREQMTFSRQPFEVTVDTAFFFSGAARKDIVNEIRRCLADGVPFITLTGVEGAGKTMVCRVVENNLPADILPILLSDGVESFDDMVRVIADQVLGDEDTTVEKRDTNALFILADHDDNPDNKDTKTLLDEISRSVRGRNQKLLIILDEAEKIYLAPLERIRRMLDSINTETIVIQLLLSGRPALAESLDQLSIVKFQEIEERHFVLEPLDSEETYHYLNHCVMVGTGEESHDFFTRDTVARIFSVAKGNFGKINLLAREYLKADELDTSFLNLIENDLHSDIPIEPEQERPIRSRVRSGMPNVDLDFLKLPSFRPEWLFYGGGICAVILLLVLLLGPSEEEQLEPEVADVQDIVLTPVEPLETPVTPVLPEQPEVPTGPEPAAAPKEVPAVTEKDVSASVPAQITEVEIIAEEPPVEQPPAQPEPVAVEPVQPEPVTAEPPQPEPVALELPQAEPAEPEQSEPVVQDAPPVEPAAEPVPPDTEATKIVVTTLKEKKDPQPEVDVAVLENEGKKLSPVQPVQVMDVEELYKKKLAAGARWLVGNNSETFTIQLMMLSSPKAEENLKQMLQTENYRAIADSLYILRKLGDVPTVKLFYGEYDTLAEARQARNNLPLFLRIHRPFTVTISDAVANTRTVQ